MRQLGWYRRSLSFCPNLFWDKSFFYVEKEVDSMGLIRWQSYYEYQ